MTTHLTTHVLNASTGVPAASVGVVLTMFGGEVVASGTTDDDGRLALGPEVLDAGEYEITFSTGTYFAAQGITAFHPRVSVAFIVEADTYRHLHVPLLLSPFAYSTYRGS